MLAFYMSLLLWMDTLHSNSSDWLDGSLPSHDFIGRNEAEWVQSGTRAEEGAAIAMLANILSICCLGPLPINAKRVLKISMLISLLCMRESKWFCSLVAILA